MLLTKTSPYHDFSIYTDGVELYYENARLKRLILRWEIYSITYLVYVTDTSWCSAMVV